MNSLVYEKGGKLFTDVDEIKTFNCYPYFGTGYILDFGDNLLKIGRSKNPYRRIKDIVNGSPKNLLRFFLSSPCTNYYDLERWMHKQLREYRQHGEYFLFDFDEAVVMSGRFNYDMDVEKAALDARLRNEQATEFFSKLINPHPALDYFNRDFHCKYCLCPVEKWEPMESFKSDQSCQFFLDVWEIAESLEVKHCIVNEGVLAIACESLKSKYHGIYDYRAAIRECCDIFDDCGVFTIELSSLL